MVEALTHLPEVELVIVGEGPERTNIEKLARKHKVADRVRLLGRVPQDRLPEIYSAADLLLLVSTHEGWPNVLLESMACGTPVVVSPMDGIADIVGTADAGRVLADVTPNGLASAIRELLRRAAVARRNPSLCRTLRLAEHDRRTNLAIPRNLGTALDGSARSGALSLMPQDTPVDLAITGDAVRP